MLKWTPKSEADLDLIREHIAKSFNVDLAIETVIKLVDFVEETLSANPLAGKVFEPNPLFSKLTYEGNAVFYCENPKDKNLYIVYVRPRGTEFQATRVNDEEFK